MLRRIVTKLHGIFFNSLKSKSDQRLVSSFNITPGSLIKVKRKKGNDHQLTNLLNVKTNSPCQHLSESIENSMENMHTDVRV